jgi:hypothetical protein
MVEAGRDIQDTCVAVNALCFHKASPLSSSSSSQHNDRCLFIVFLGTKFLQFQALITLTSEFSAHLSSPPPVTSERSTTLPNITQITVTTTTTIESSPNISVMSNPPQYILLPSTINCGSPSATTCSSHISCTAQLERPQPKTRMSQFVPQHKLKTMADLDKGEESRLAIKNRHRKQEASRVVKWWSRKLGK